MEKDVIMTIDIGRFKYTSLKKRDDVTSMPLLRNLFGINNRIYANLGSYDMTEENRQLYSKHYRDDELRFACLNRLFEVHLKYRDLEDEYHTIESIDFKPLYNKIIKEHSEWERCYVSFNDDGDKSDKELGVLLIPLGSDILYNAANYAAQEIESLKMDNFLNLYSDSKHLNNFINLFQ